MLSSTAPGVHGALEWMALLESNQGLGNHGALGWGHPWGGGRKQNIFCGPGKSHQALSVTAIQLVKLYFGSLDGLGISCQTMDPFPANG